MLEMSPGGIAPPIFITAEQAQVCDVAAKELGCYQVVHRAKKGHTSISTICVSITNL